LTETSDM